ncbi:hypothetical protein [Butyrivibrio proteoclasticus]|uniref:hypothetical protein n=1 Tax=Butyrivibrio proteoclasticus TaxID=43305 RepID=UPI00047DA985|nr:hypothetical protein [Butyrivibrio proteoclasticus]
MCEALKELMADELKEAHTKGELVGTEIGKDTVNRLNEILLKEGRLDDLKKATTDSEFQNKLIKDLL